MHKEGQGKLDIVMSLQNGQLQCIISDNGVGRAKASELKSKSGEKQKSFGLKITTERLALFNNENIVRTFYNIEDLIDEVGNVEGTEVTLLIKHKDDVKVPLVKAI
jgi:signal transduction histidine kinase